MGGARMISENKFTTYEYRPPYFNIYNNLTPEQFSQRFAGQTIYERIGSLNEYLVEKQSHLYDTILNAKEKMLADALFLNQITLANGRKIEFNRLDSHYLTVAKRWSTADSNPLQDIQQMATLNVKDGNADGSQVQHLICGSNVAMALLSNPQFRENSNLNNAIRQSDIMLPQWNGSGAVFHGRFSAGSFLINLWSYNAELTVPTGYNLAGEGTSKPIIPTGTALLMLEQPNIKMYYAGLSHNAAMINTLTNDPNALLMQKARTSVYSYWKEINPGETVFVYGVKSRPLPVPINNNDFSILTQLI